MSMENKSGIRKCFASFVIVCGLASTPLALGLTINLSYDSTVTSLPNVSAVETATNYAAQQLQNLFTNSITININVQADDSDFGASGTGLGGIYSFANIRSDLAAKATTAVDTSSVTMLNALPDPTQGGNFWIPGAEMKALGLSDPNGTGNDGTFVFGPDNPWNFSTTNRSVSGEYDFVGVALHELTECMGRTSVLGGDLNSSPGWIPFDLFRFTSPGTESVNQVDSSVYFSVDQGKTNLKNYNNPSNGGDLQDWDSTTTDAADAASVQGTENDFSPADIATLDAIGYTPVTAARTLNWDGTTNTLDTTHWLNGSTNVPAYIGATLAVASGTVTYESPDSHSNLILSSSSIYGTGLTITGGTVRTIVNTYVSGLGAGTGAGLYLTTGSSLNLSGSGQLDLAGELVIGGDAGSNVTATISGGSLVVGQNTSGNVDRTLYVGLSGTGTLNQSGASTVSTQNLYIASAAGSVGTYKLTAGSLTVSNATVLGGNASTAGGSAAFTLGPGNGIRNGVMQTASLKIWSGALNVTDGELTVTAATSNAGTIQLNSGEAQLQAITGTGSIVVGGKSGDPGDMSVLSINQNSLTITNGGSLTLTGRGLTNAVQSLTMSDTSYLDLSTNILDINYTASSPVAVIRSYLVSAYDKGSWDGPGIGTIFESTKNTIGYVDTGSQVIVKYTWAGDANLDGVVNAADFAAIKSNGTTWATGDFNYDSVVNSDDYALYMLGAAAGKANISTTLPEPDGLMAIAVLTLLLSRRSMHHFAVISSANRSAN